MEAALAGEITLTDVMSELVTVGEEMNDAFFGQDLRAENTSEDRRRK